MKILNVNATLDPINGGGTAERTYQLSCHLASKGIETTILTLDLGVTTDQIQRANKVRIVMLQCIIKRFYIPKFKYREIVKLISEVDIVHIMGHWTFLNALVYVILKRLNKTYVVCPAGALPIYGRSRLLKWSYNLLVGKKLIRNANRHIAIASTEIEQFEKYGVPGKKILVIQNGVNPEDFMARSTADFRKQIVMNNCEFVLYLGRLNHIKGPDLALNAFCNIREEYPNYKLLFVGPDNGMLSRLKQIIKARNAEDEIHFIDYLGGEEKSRVYDASTLLIIPSRQEAMSIVVLEAGITGTPVLLTDQCGFDQLASVGGGYVVTASIKGIEDGLRKMLKDTEELKKMGARLKKYIEGQLTWSIIAQHYITAYGELQTRQ